MNSERTISLPVRLEGGYINTIIKEFHEAFKQKPKSILFDFSRTSFFDSFGLVTATCLILRLLQEQNIALKVKHSAKTEVRQQLRNIGFGEFFGLQGIENIDGTSVDIESSSRIRLKALSTVDEQFIAEATEFLANWVKMSQGVKYGLADALGEAIDNAMTHSGADIAIACGIAYPNEKKVDICVGDIGIGIPTHLRKNPQYKGIESDAKAVSLAVQEGVTGTNEARGIGLSQLQQIALATGGDIRIASLYGMYYMKRERQNPIVRKLDGMVLGTIVGAQFGILPTNEWIVAKTKNGRIF